MQETFGKELVIIYLDKISFGSNMPIWRNCLANFKRPEIYSESGWNGCQVKRLGRLI
jgi:hypothetical protein